MDNKQVFGINIILSISCFAEGLTLIMDNQVSAGVLSLFIFICLFVTNVFRIKKRPFKSFIMTAKNIFNISDEVFGNSSILNEHSIEEGEDVITHLQYNPHTKKWSIQLMDYRKDEEGDVIPNEDGSNLLDYIKYVDNY